VRRGGGYAAELDPQAVDLHRFRRLVSRTRQRRDVEAVSLLSQALEEWTGSPLSDLGGRWVDNLRVVLEAERAGGRSPAPPHRVLAPALRTAARPCTGSGGNARTTPLPGDQRPRVHDHPETSRLPGGEFPQHGELSAW